MKSPMTGHLIKVDMKRMKAILKQRDFASLSTDWQLAMFEEPAVSALIPTKIEHMTRLLGTTEFCDVPPKWQAEMWKTAELKGLIPQKFDYIPASYKKVTVETKETYYQKFDGQLRDAMASERRD